MGRNKIKIETKAVSQQFVTYNKRKAGIAKKARELAILCDTDVLLLTISPKGKPDLVVGPKSDFEGVIKKFSQQNPNERHKKKRECLQALSKAFQSDKDHEVDVEKLMKLGIPEISPAIKSKQDFLNLTRDIQHARSLLGPLQYIDEVFTTTDIGLLDSMEYSIKKLIRMNRMQHDNYMQMVTDLPYFPNMTMNCPVALNGGGISHSTVHLHNSNGIPISDIFTNPPTLMNSPTNEGNTAPQLFKGDVQKLPQRKVTGQNVSISAPSTVVAPIPEEGRYWDCFNFDKVDKNLQVSGGTHDMAREANCLSQPLTDLPN